MASLTPDRYEGRFASWHDLQEWVLGQKRKFGIIFERSSLGKRLGYGTAFEYLLGDANQISISLPSSRLSQRVIFLY